MKLAVLCLTVLLALPALAAQPAKLARDADLKAKPFNDAETVGKLNANTVVDVLARQAAWVQVKADKTGWLRLLNLRGASDAGAADIGVDKMMSLYFTGSTGSTATTGVKGLSEADINAAHPNEAERAKLVRYAAKPAEAEAYAKKAGLTSRKVDYLPTN